MKAPIVLLGLLAVATGATAEVAAHVAGLAPASRPAGAPVITRFEQTPAWKAQALRGIHPPQNGVEFLKDQGAWYTPFNHPNSTGRYDIRDLYGEAAGRD
jgi:hypothetical protein